MAHAVLSPSHAHTWAQCLASAFYEKGMPNEESPYAAEGTQAHALAEQTLNHTFEEAIFDAPDAPHEMVENVKMYTDFVSNLIREHEGCFYAFEHSVDLSKVTGEVGSHGTIDALVATDGHLWVTDLKYGAGVPVMAERNEQLCIYALAAIDELSVMYDIKDVTLTIVQPRCGGINSWDISAELLELFRARLLPRAKRAFAIYEEKEAITPEDFICDEATCRWCRGKTKCPNFAETTRAALLADYDEPSAPAELTTISVPDDPEKLSKAYTLLPIVKTWCDMVQESMSARLGQGEKIPGYKLVAGRKGARKWSDESAVETLMKGMRLKRDEMYTHKLISPTQFESAIKANPNLLGKGQVEKLRDCITQSEGKPAVVVESDPRPSLTVASSSDYEALPN